MSADGLYVMWGPCPDCKCIKSNLPRWPGRCLDCHRKRFPRPGTLLEAAPQSTRQ